MSRFNKPNKTYHHAFKIQYPGITRALVSDVTACDFENKNRANFKAIWDTGATNSVITKNVVDGLKLVPTGITKVFGVNSSCEQPTYLINLILPNRVNVVNINVTECNLNSPGNDLLIGMDVICIGDFSISNYGQKTTFCFSAPPHHNIIDLVEKSQRSNRRKN